MCGIAGILSIRPEGPPPSDSRLRAAASALAHRGPDDEGFYRDGRVGLAFRRLSILDLSGGHQPMGNEDGSVQVVFNGEIYNYREISAKLAARGHRFRTHSDTEVLVHLYEERGADLVDELRGMFAFALWDARRRILLLARDRLGIKPLFYGQRAEELVFASEIKGILAMLPDQDRAPDEANLARYLSVGYFPGERTAFRGIRKLPPGHLLVCDEGRISSRRYWSVPEVVENPGFSREEAVLRLRELLEESVRLRLISDVPLGAFLSGGVDSSCVVSLMRRVSSDPVKTFTIGVEDRDRSEIPEAKEVSEALGTQHHELLVRPHAIEDVPRLVWHLDQPFADSSALPTYYVSRAARQHVTVALSGDGGDELFAGYQRRYGIHRLEQRLRRLIPEPARRGLLAPLGRIYPRWQAIPRPLRLKLVLENLGQSFERAYFDDLSMFRGREKSDLLSPEFQRQVAHHDSFTAFGRHFERVRDADPLSRILYVDFKTWLANDILVKVDRMSMACSLEVRAPLLDHRIVEFAASLPPELKYRGRVSKYLLKRHLERRLPEAAVHRQKHGFVIPIAQWLRGELSSFARELLFSARASGRGYLQTGTVQRIWDAHQAGRRDHSGQIWALMVLELWHRAYVDAS